MLDINVLSELMRPEPHLGICLGGRPAAHTRFTPPSSTAPGCIAALPTGSRKNALAAAAEAVFSEHLAGRILPFNDVTAVHYARLVPDRSL